MKSHGGFNGGLDTFSLPLARGNKNTSIQTDFPQFNVFYFVTSGKGRSSSIIFHSFLSYFSFTFSRPPFKTLGVSCFSHEKIGIYLSLYNFLLTEKSHLNKPKS